MSPRLVQAVAFAAVGFAVLSPAAHASTWSAPVTVAPALGGASPSAASPSIAADADGDLTAAWASDGAAGYGVYSATRAADPASGWSTPVRLSGASAPRNVQVSVNASGQAVAGWTDADLEGNQVFLSASRSVSGAWTAAMSISTGSSNDATRQLAIDPSGRIFGLSAQDGDVLAFAAPAGGNLTKVSAPAQTMSGDQSPFELAIDATGAATAVFVDDTELAVKTTNRPAGGNWTTPVTLEAWTPPAEAGSPAIISPQIAATSDGRLVAGWVRGDRSATARVEIRTADRTASGQWSAPSTVQTLLDQQTALGFDIGIDASGGRIAAWNTLGATLVSGQPLLWNQIRTSRAPAGGGWGAVQNLSPLESSTLLSDGTYLVQSFSALQLSVGPTGATAAVWKRGFGPMAEIHAAVRYATGSWADSSQVAAAGSVGDDDSAPASVVVDQASRGTLLAIDGPAVESRSIALEEAPAPAPVDDGGTKDPGQQPSSGNQNSPATNTPNTPPAANTPAPPAPAAKAAKLAISLYVLPKGKKCPALAGATVDGVRTNLKVKKTKLRKKLACKVTGTVVLKPTVKVGAKVKVLVTAKGIKKKTVELPAIA